MTNLCGEKMRNCFTNLSNVFRKRTAQNRIEDNHGEHDENDDEDIAELNVKIDQLTTNSNNNNNNATSKSTTISCGASEIENNSISENDKKLLKLMIKNDGGDKKTKNINKSDQTSPSLAKSAEFGKEQQQQGHSPNINNNSKKNHKVKYKKRNNDKNANMADGSKMAKMLEAYREQQWWRRRQQEDEKEKQSINGNNIQIVMNNANDLNDKNDGKAMTIKAIVGNNDDVKDVKIADKDSDKPKATTHNKGNVGCVKEVKQADDEDDENDSHDIIIKDDDGDASESDNCVDNIVECDNHKEFGTKAAKYDKETGSLLMTRSEQKQDQGQKLNYHHQQEHQQQKPSKVQPSCSTQSPPAAVVSTNSYPGSEHSCYIDEYRSLVDERNQVIRSSYGKPEKSCNMEEALNLSSLRERAIAQSNRNNRLLQVDATESVETLNNDNAATKTPEEIEYEAQVAAEGADVMTPLPSTLIANSNKHVFPLVVGRNVQPEIVEVIRNLDAHALRINNLTLDDKLELMRRFEVSSAHQHQHQHNTKRHTYSRKHHRHNQHVDLKRLSSDGNGRQHPSALDTVDSSGVDALTSLLGADYENEDAVVLRKKQPVGLFARRQPLSPKLRLQMPHNSNDSAAEMKRNANRAHKEDDTAERNLIDLKYPTVLPPNPQLKALLIFHKWDNISEVLTEACHRQQMEVTMVKTKEAALETLQSNTMSSECFHLIIIDARSCKHLDAEYITRSIRHTNGHHFTTIIAVVKKSFFEKDDVLIALLDAGVNRCMAETTNISVCNIEIKQILHSIVRPHNVMSTQQALYTALHRLKEVLIISDDVLRIQYANKSAERLLNMRLDEIISKPLADIFVSDVSSISAHGKSIREFDGILTVRRKSQDGIPMHVRVVPVACIGRTPTHFVFNFDVPGGQTDFIATLPQPKEAPRGSLHSIRRGSFDVRSVASDGLRRTSLAKLTSLPLEAPITKIINLLSQVQETSSADEARLIDKVLEFLKREGLYSPQMKELRPDDPIATDLIGALLTGPSLYSSRRSSNDSIIRVSNRPSGLLPAKMKATPLIMEQLEESLSWEFDIFKLEEITEKRPLLYLGMEMFRRFDMFATFNIEENVCKSWLAVIEANYHAQNSYHNSTHAADVMQATGAFITQLAVKDMVMDRMDEATALIAAAAHDIDHPGRSSAFLCNSNSPLAILYNDLTVLESHHAAITFKLTLGDDKINIFKNLEKETYKSVRSTIIDMILATEMTRHFEHLAKFVSVFGTDVEPRDIVQNEEESQILIRRMLIKVADVSNPARPPVYCVEWARRIAEEYFTQTDEEKAKALPIVMPMFDRGTCSIPKSQIGFIEYIIQDMMHAWDSFIDMPQLITYMQMNYAQWKKFEEQGIHTLADIKTKQVTLNAKKSTCK